MHVQDPMPIPNASLSPHITASTNNLTSLQRNLLSTLSDLLKSIAGLRI